MNNTKEEIQDMIEGFKAVISCLEGYNSDAFNKGLSQMFICNLLQELTYSNTYRDCMSYFESEKPDIVTNTEFTKHDLWNGGAVWWNTSNKSKFDPETITVRIKFLQHLIDKLEVKLNS